MTQDHVAGFASELVKMAQAVERVPQLERDVAEWQRMASMRTDRIIELEVALEANRAYAAGLEQRIHDAEVARDNAELRFLEVDDAKDTLVRVLDNLGKDIIGALQAVAQVPTLSAEESRKLMDEMPITESTYPAAGDPTQDTSSYGGASAEVSPQVMEALSVDAPLVNDGPFNGTAGQSEADPTSSALSPNPTTSADVVEPALVSDTAVASSTGEGVSVLTDPTAPPTEHVSSPTAGTVETTDGARTHTDPFAPPAQPIKGSPPAQSSDTSTGDDTGEPQDKYSNEWYHWVDAVPSRRLRILGY